MGKQKRKTVRISAVNKEYIEFSNGDKITYYHNPDCCENNYADFFQIEPLAKKIDFITPIIFESVPNCGFRFGNTGIMFFIPCYSEQNGYYSSNIEIHYNGKRVLKFDAEGIDN